jgi:pimeloyl-ACP methyl ester carboxylesterase
MSVSAQAQELPRAGMLGVGGPTTGTGGAVVERIAPNSTAQALGLVAGDIITLFNGAPVTNMGDVVRAMPNARSGDVLRVQVKRGNANLQLQGPVKAKPLETYAGATVRYGAVTHNGGQLRDILVTPDNKPNAPIVYLIQGYTCYSIEANTPGGALYKELIEGLLARGIGFYRVEKAGIGDSRGGTSCAQGGFDAELDGFKAGYARLQSHYGIAPNRAFLLGHSMGGIQAPLVAAASGQNQPRGVAVYGTGLRNWHDYMVQVVGIQSFFSSGNDPAELEQALEIGRSVLKAIYLDGKTVAEAAALGPKEREFLVEFMDWDGSETLLYRTATYWRQLSGQRLTAAWRDTRAQVLSLYGEVDFAAVDATDQRRIADVANHYRPGSGQFVMVPRTGHGMQIEGTPGEVRAAARAGTAAPPTAKPYNAEITKLLADWVDASMLKPTL